MTRPGEPMSPETSTKAELTARIAELSRITDTMISNMCDTLAYKEQRLGEEQDRAEKAEARNEELVEVVRITLVERDGSRLMRQEAEAEVVQLTWMLDEAVLDSLDLIERSVTTAAYQQKRADLAARWEEREA